MKSSNIYPKYKKDVCFGIGHKGLRSKPLERRSKKDFRRWLRRKVNKMG